MSPPFVVQSRIANALLRSLLFWVALVLAGLAIYFSSSRIDDGKGRDGLAGLPEGAKYLAGYGPNRYSQFAEEWIIRDFFKDRRGGVFVDVGANHYKNDSTTFYL